MQLPKISTPKISGKGKMVQPYQGTTMTPKAPETAKRSYYRGGTKPKPQAQDTPFDGFPEYAK